MIPNSDCDVAVIDPLDELVEINPVVEEAVIDPLGPAELADVDPWI
jgi:hypothetical protein